jgi:2-polyprenyl-3-methyl-5-hydroxy-6-metoxy-1,4-benzoquinol methylase
MPSDEALQAHYQNPAYYCGDEEQGYRNYDDTRRALWPHLKRRLRTLNHLVPARGSVLDFGCAAGFFLAVARADGWQIAGVELAHEMAQRASQTLGIPIANSLTDIGETAFEAITLWEVLEHLPRPVEELRRLYAQLKPNGVLMLSTPNNGHWQAIREPDEWLAYRPPSHLCYFTAATLGDALTRAGFERVSVQRVSPLPPLPAWLRRVSTPLQRSLINAEASNWALALWMWRAIRVMGWGWQKIAHRHDDIFMTLEAIAFRHR